MIDDVDWSALHQSAARVDTGYRCNVRMKAGLFSVLLLCACAVCMAMGGMPRANPYNARNPGAAVEPERIPADTMRRLAQLERDERKGYNEDDSLASGGVEGDDSDSGDEPLDPPPARPSRPRRVLQNLINLFSS